MARLFECALNFSEGRRQEVIEQIVRAAGAPGVRVLDVAANADHNRTVLSFVGPAEGVEAAAVAVAGACLQLIDMNQHHGAHPRMGAVDVIPLVPLGEATMAEAVGLAERIGSRLGGELGLPVFLYEEAARRPEGRNLADVRRGEWEGLADRMASADWRPDYGPERPHPTGGATAVGARAFLVAYNVNLGTGDVRVAKEIAHAVRARDGGLAGVKALGLALAEPGRVQVSMNVVDPFRTPLYRVLELVRLEAARYGVAVVGSEVVGMLPLAVLLETARYYLQAPGLGEGQVLEARLWGEDERGTAGL
jgi:glutamate formiminotransferase / 5-formyltetrahydrofolate cyclo-ligase